MRIFFLDDDPLRVLRFRGALAAEDVELTVARSVAEGVEKFKGPYDGVFLDHDLGDHVFMQSDHEETGMEFLRRIDRGGMAGARIIVLHSFNPDGAKNMEALLAEDSLPVVVCPFGPTVLRIAQAVAGDE